MHRTMGWIYCRRKWDPSKAKVEMSAVLKNKMIMMGFTYAAGKIFMKFTAKLLLVLLFCSE
jgi:hypothetical protein